MSNSPDNLDARALPLLVESVRDYAIFVLDQTGVIRSWNNGAQRIKGYKAHEIIGKHFSLFYTPEDNAIKKPARALEIAVKEGRYEEEGWRMRSDGTRFWASVVITALKDASGTLQGFGKVTRDLTARKQQEDLLRNERELFRVTLESIGDAVITTDHDGKVTYLNVIAEQLTRWSRKDAAGRPLREVFNIINEETRKPAPSPVECVLREGIIVGLANHTVLIGRDGTETAIDDSAAPIRDSSGAIVGVVMVFRDVAEARKAERLLRESEERFRLLVQNVKEYGIFMLDPKGNIASWNAGARNIMGYERSEILGRHFSAFYPEDDVRAQKPQRELELALKNGTYEEEGWRVRKDGERFWSSVLITTLYDESGVVRGFAKVTRDMTERRKQEEEREQLIHAQAAREEAERVNRIKDEFLLTLSHELRTPLTPLLGWTRIIRARAIDDPIIENGMKIIERNVQAQTAIINDLLDVSRLLTGSVTLNVRPVNIKEIIEVCIETLRHAAETKGITLRLTLDSAISQIIGDSVRLQQIFWNLLSNAIKFSLRGGIVETVLVQRDNNLIVTVKDTGIGIDPSYMPQLFRRFSQADSSITRAHGGLGIGLSIVKHLTELHGGTVSATSEGKSKGATFTVTLPIPSPSELADRRREQRERAPASKHENPNLSGCRVLVVDDEPDTCELLLFILQNAGATVETALSVADAVPRLATFKPDILLSDIGMPGENGYLMLEKLRATGSKIPAIAISAFARNEDRDRALKAGFQDFLSKPLESSDLMAMVKNACAR
ncbi:MAG TPA: PAS domain S-box protein [Planctomycetota bacterium]|nr:PAS domain S-box protein [Planctomycetota bacterium]